MEDSGKESLRVVDKRLFTRSGERRASVPGEPAFPQTPEPPAPEPQAPKGPESDPPASPLFEGLVGFLAENAVASVRAGAPLSNFTIFIDFLEMLRAKTSGNLASRETRVLDETLGEMKLIYLQMSKKKGSKGP